MRINRELAAGVADGNGCPATLWRAVAAPLPCPQALYHRGLQLTPHSPCPTDTLVAVLERDTLGIREVRLFNAVVRWSEAECQRQQLQVVPENKRKTLGKALSLIRFPLMTIEEFAAGKRGALP